MRCRLLISIVFVLFGMWVVRPAEAAENKIRVEVDPRTATVGDHLTLTLRVTLASDLAFDPPRLGPRLGSFELLFGGWTDPSVEATEAHWTWSGKIAAYDTGALEFPAVSIEAGRGSKAVRLSSLPFQITIESVLGADSIVDDAPELNDLKAPASLEPELGTLFLALALLGSMLLLAVVLWWLRRRYGHKLVAVAPPDDPFHRTPPHVWVYAELQRLLERRLAEQGGVDRFYAEVSRILKTYLAGRFRVEMLERTTAEAPRLLTRTGAPRDAVAATRGLLESCDRVKFARERPGPDEWREVIEQVYRIVDRTKPADAEASPRGAA